MIVAAGLDRISEALGALIAHRIRWTPIGQRARIAIDASGDERWIGKHVTGTIRAYGELTRGPLLIQLAEPLDYHGHYNAPALELLVLAPVIRWHGPARLLVTWAAVRLVDAPTFADQEYGRTVATGRLALTSCRQR